MLLARGSQSFMVFGQGRRPRNFQGEPTEKRPKNSTIKPLSYYNCTMYKNSVGARPAAADAHVRGPILKSVPQHQWPPIKQ